MSSTAFLLVTATEPSEGSFPVAFANVAGDSSAFEVRDGSWTPLTTVKNQGDSIISSAVRSLPDTVEVVPRTALLSQGTTLVVVTDGLGDPLGSGTGIVSAFLSERWSSPPEMLEFAQQIAFYRRTFADDRTAVVVWLGAPWAAAR
jgi:hypothetical protein